MSLVFQGGNIVDVDVRPGQWERISLRQAWPTEDRDFTHWLAKPENLAWLGKAIGLELEPVGIEQPVGQFRADIVCKNTADGSSVIIENQLESTDHDHLGKLLTYAAGHEAITIVWIADRIRDEHGTTLDWLNARTDERANLFGIEVELWKLGDSVSATFNVVSRPGGSAEAPSGPRRSVGGSSRTRSSTGGSASPRSLGAPTPLQQLYLDYWTEFSEVVKATPGPVRPQKPSRQSWYGVATGRSHFLFYAQARTKEREIRVGLHIDSELRTVYFRLLHEQKGDIETELGVSLEWLELPDTQISRIILRKPDTDVEDRTAWPDQHQWLLDKLTAFHRVFGPRIRALDTGL